VSGYAKSTVDFNYFIPYYIHLEIVKWRDEMIKVMVFVRELGGVEGVGMVESNDWKDWDKMKLGWIKETYGDDEDISLDGNRVMCGDDEEGYFDIVFIN